MSHEMGCYDLAHEVVEVDQGIHIHSLVVQQPLEDAGLDLVDHHY